MPHKSEDHNPNKLPRTRDKIKGGVKDGFNKIFHRTSSSQARKDEGSGTPSSLSQIDSSDRTPASIPAVDPASSATQTTASGPLPFSPASTPASKNTAVKVTEPKSGTIFTLADYPNVTHFLKGPVLSGLAIAADASNIPGLKAAVAAIQGLVKFAELERTTETMKEIMAENTSSFAEWWKQGEIDDKIKERTSALKNARKKFMALNGALSSASNRLILQASKDIITMLMKQENAKSKWKLSNLPYIKAAYDQDENIRTCHEDTRTAIISDVRTRRLSLSEQYAWILWLRASAGSGKSTIAKTVAESLGRHLARSFFFARTIPVRSSLKDFFATLANQLAVRDVTFATELMRVIVDNPELQHAEPTKQLKELFIKPSAVLSSSKRFVFVLDALDECGEDQGALLVRLLLDHIHELPPSFRFIVTSRPEAPLINQFSSSKTDLVQTINIDKKAHEATSHADIKTYFFAELGDVPNLNVQKHEIAVLVRLANGLFQFAATVVRLIKGLNPYQGPRETLDSILDLGGDPSQRVLSLHDLYGNIFKRAYPRPAQPHEGKPYSDMIARYHLAVEGIVHTREPVSMKTLAALINLSEEIVMFTLQRLSSVLLLPDSKDLDTPIRIRHLTFKEYITDVSGPLARDHGNLVIDNRTEVNLAEGAFFIMTNDLHFNISNITTSFLPNNAYPPSHFEAAIHSALSYACRFWRAHLEQTPAGIVPILLLVTTFIEEKLLFWLEALSALGAVNIARAALVSLGEWFASIDSKQDARISQTKTLVKDAIKYAEYFAPIIAQSAPHTYASTIPFAPASSPIAQLYAPRFPNTISLAIGRLSDWPARQLIFHGHSSSVLSVASSPDGKHIVSGSHDRTIRVWDVETGQTVAGPFEGHSDSVNSVAFSPDGKHIVSGSTDHTIRILDLNDLHKWSSFGDQVVLGDDGWVRGSDDELLLWVPPPHRLSFHSPHTSKVIGPHETRVDCSKVAWGTEWTSCYNPPAA